ncbi:MAG: hypothetical protein ACTSVV_02055, partial [Promethearchaeota archaeon]
MRKSKIPFDIQNLEELRVFVNVYSQIQKSRIQIQNSKNNILNRCRYSQEKLDILFDGFDMKLKKFEQCLRNKIEKYVKQHELWKKWLKDVKGMGTLNLAYLLIYIKDPGRFATISKLWKFCGFDPNDKRKRGQKCNFNVNLKKICRNIADNLVKRNGIYRTFLYDNIKKK